MTQLYRSFHCSVILFILTACRAVGDDKPMSFADLKETIDRRVADWQPTADVLMAAARCLQENEKGYQREIASIEASEDPPARKAAKIARRQQYIAKGRRQTATAWFDIAVACYNLSRKADAQEYAEKVAADEEFGARARELLSRLR